MTKSLTESMRVLLDDLNNGYYLFAYAYDDINDFDGFVGLSMSTDAMVQRLISIDPALYAFNQDDDNEDDEYEDEDDEELNSLTPGTFWQGKLNSAVGDFNIPNKMVKFWEWDSRSSTSFEIYQISKEDYSLLAQKGLTQI